MSRELLTDAELAACGLVATGWHVANGERVLEIHLDLFNRLVDSLRAARADHDTVIRSYNMACAENEMLRGQLAAAEALIVSPSDARLLLIDRFDDDTMAASSRCRAIFQRIAAMASEPSAERAG